MRDSALYTKWGHVLNGVIGFETPVLRSFHIKNEQCIPKITHTSIIINLPFFLVFRNLSTLEQVCFGFFVVVLLGGILIISSVYIVETVFLKKASKMQFLYVFLYCILHPEELFGHGNLMPLSPFYTVSLC